ncbi:Pretoxin HINT domain-containing protein [Singulisphaera sp. GP187]|uniref:polymorphic toxin-type HINT domain-containing protein n=1 Tax=Singulisphaera sp. GP187 TaxID=1882752 RepID=UPI000929680F|nr:polymorphic toxin-type HINT domain-containing protein [Singulisphaera sp. GP187]SIO56134.1 Pretoxin HINT domain-containing protein [Singulisphaera sp. GP187]
MTGQDFGDDRESWLAWWTNAQGYAYIPPRPSAHPKPTVDQEILLPYVPRYLRITGCSCFGSGTPVWTRQGQRAIDTIRVGDVVLTQESETGTLRFDPVLAVFHNKPAPTLQIQLDDGCEPLVVTGIHRFWLAGKGWVMGRDLSPGDRIRTLGGQARVTAVSPGSVQPVFNLEVGEHQNFFAGQAGALVHDNSLVEPVSHPFDQQEEGLAARRIRP